MTKGDVSVAGPFNKISSFLSLNRFDLVWLGLLLVTRLAFILYLYPDKSRMTNGDSALYEGLALGLIEQGQYRYSAEANPFHDLIRPPGYPLLIALVYLIFSKNFLWVVLLNLPALAATYIGIKKLFAVLRISNPHLLTLLVFGLDLTWFLYTKNVSTELIFTPLLVFSVLYLLRYSQENRIRALFFSAFLAGLCTLLKPITLYFMLPVGLWLLYKKRARALRPIALYTLCFLLPVLPWFIRNQLTHNTFSYTYIQADNLALAHGAFVYADVHNLEFEAAQEVLERKVVARLAAMGSDSSFADVNAVKMELARQILFYEHPIVYARTIARGMAITLFDPGRLDFNLTFPTEDTQPMGFTQTLGQVGVVGTLQLLSQKSPLMMVSLFTYLLFLLLFNAVAVLGIKGFWQHHPDAFLLITLLVLYLLVLGGPNGYARFRLYIFPFLLVYFHFGITFLQQFILKRKTQKAGDTNTRLA